MIHSAVNQDKNGEGQERLRIVHILTERNSFFCPSPKGMFRRQTPPPAHMDAPRWVSQLVQGYISLCFLLHGKILKIQLKFTVSSVSLLCS